MKLKIDALLIVGVVSLSIFVGCGKKEPADMAQIVEQARQTIHQEIQRVVKEPERAENILMIADEFIPLVEKIFQDQAAYLKEMRDVDAIYDSSPANYRAIADRFREKKRAHVYEFLAIRDRVKSEMSTDEWEQFSKLRTKMRAALGVAAGGS